MPQPVVGLEVREPTVGGRERGRTLFQAALEGLERAPDGATVTVSLRGVRIMDFSAADEFLAKLLRRVASGELGERRLVLAGLSPEVRETVMAVLQLRGLQCFEDRGRDGWHVLGDMSPPLRETLAVINEKHVVTARDIVDATNGLELTAATNRLTALVRAGLVLRRPDAAGRQGRRFVYESITPPPTRSAAPVTKTGAHPAPSRGRGRERR